MLVSMSTRTAATSVAWLAAREESARLKATRGSGVVDWGRPRRAVGRYEAYWRGMSLGLFISQEEAQAFLAGLH